MALSVQEMLGDFLKMLILSTAMSLSSFVCGLLPLSINLSPLYLRYISLLSMGILLSTSLVLIIPEGISSIFEATEKATAPILVGLLLLAGFVFMYIIDHIHLLGKLLPQSVKYTGMENDLELQETRQIEVKNGVWQKFVVRPLSKIGKPLISSPLTLGLVIHSVTDGVVLTSSIFSSNESLNLIMFFAIFVHKLPTSFSLVSILIAEGYQKSVVKLHLFIFSSSLMIGSILSFIAFQLYASSDSSKTETHIAYLLMLSGGTFLYIGVHTMIEILGEDGSTPPNSSSSEDTIIVPQRGDEALDLKEFGITLLGFILPLFVLLVKE